MPTRPPSRKAPRAPGSTIRREPIDADRKRLDAFIDSRAWRRLRNAYIADRPLCEQCRSEGVITPAAHVHHKQARADRPDLALDRENLQSLCRPCHSRATLTEAAARRPGPA